MSQEENPRENSGSAGGGVGFGGGGGTGEKLCARLHSRLNPPCRSAACSLHSPHREHLIASESVQKENPPFFFSSNGSALLLFALSSEQVGRRNAGLRRLHVARRRISLSLYFSTKPVYFWRQRNGLFRHTVAHRAVTLEGMDLGLGSFPSALLFSAFLVSTQPHFCLAGVGHHYAPTTRLNPASLLAGVLSEEHLRLPNQCPCSMAVYFSLMAYRSVPSDCSPAGRLCDETTPVLSEQRGIRPRIKRRELLLLHLLLCPCFSAPAVLCS